ncbi:hypothetical protein F4819DRAFT_307934 [Hypoxylon fuscum]|nr:hypothetical protein F4819DRAFT_307934 [Hypoxylon fuscum]
MHSITPRRVVRALKRALTRVRRSRQSRSPPPKTSTATTTTTISMTMSSAIQKGVQNIPGLLLYLLQKFLELNQHVHPFYDLREPGSVGNLTSSYVLISSTTSLLAVSRSAPNPARASACEAEAAADIPLVAMSRSPPSKRFSSTTARSDLSQSSRDSRRISAAISSMSTWASA